MTGVELYVNVPSTEKERVQTVPPFLSLIGVRTDVMFCDSERSDAVTDGALHIRDIIITAPIILQIVRLMITSFTFLYQGKYLCGIAKQHRHSSYNCYFYFTFTLTILLNLPVLTCLPTLL